MIRRFNYTGRQKIERSRIQVSIHGSGDDRAFNVSLDLDGLGLPGDAPVFVEVISKYFFMRYSCGVAANFRPPDDRNLRGLSPDAIPGFNVKIVEPGGNGALILARADGLRPKLADGEEHRLSLLHVDFVDLGSEVWQLEYEGVDFPVLKLNNRLPTAILQELDRPEGLLFSLVYPAVVREILGRILWVEGPPSDWVTNKDWPGSWIRFANSIVGEPPPHLNDEISAEQKSTQSRWIDSVVTTFSRKHDCVGGLTSFLEERHGNRKPTN